MNDLVPLIVLIEATFAVLTFVTVLAHAVWLRLSEPRKQQRIARLSAVVAEFLDSGKSFDTVAGLLCSLRHRAQLELLAPLAGTLSGKPRERLQDLANALGIFEIARRRCRSVLWWRRLHGGRLFTLFGGGDVEVQSLFDDPREEVRAQAAEWGADQPNPHTISRLVEMLADPATLCRFTVKDSLLRLGSLGVPPLASRLRPGQPALAELLEVASWIGDSRLLEPASALRHHAAPEVRARAVALIGQFGGSDAAAALTDALDDADGDVRAAAAHALGRLHHWPSAAALAAGLRDPVWDVRKEAALALRAFGAPGLLLLRRALSDEDRFAADMAQQALDIPDTGARSVRPRI